MILGLLALAASDPSLELAAVGDIMLGRHVGRRIEREGADVLFDAVRPELQKADIAFGNLECVLGDAPFTVPKRIRLRGSPASASALARAGFDILSVANNHAMDAGIPGLAQTQSALRRAGIRTAGVAVEPTVLKVKGIRVGFLAYCDFSPRYGPRTGIRYLDERKVEAEVARAKSKADLLVVSIHWGEEGQGAPTARQIRLGRLIGQAGAGLVLGHHPHVLQPIQTLKFPSGRTCMIAYSLGNFVFDATSEAERQTMILKIRLSRSGVESYRFSSWRIDRGAPVSTLPFRSKSPGSHWDRE